MQDEVSETENIRRNLSIERQFAEGCEELLDVEQIFIRQGILLSIDNCKNLQSMQFLAFFSLSRTVYLVFFQICNQQTWPALSLLLAFHCLPLLAFLVFATGAFSQHRYMSKFKNKSSFPHHFWEWGGTHLLFIRLWATRLCKHSKCYSWELAIWQHCVFYSYALSRSAEC